MAMAESGEAAVEALGAFALKYVRAGQVLGLGTGRAATAFIRALGASGMKVRGVPTSNVSEALARELGIEIAGLGDVKRIDITFDGADEVDPRLNLIKGYGGALIREKVVACASRRQVILVGAEKLVRRLGARGRVPVEVIPFAAPFCARQMRSLGLKPAIRTSADGSEFRSDNGNLIIDCVVRPGFGPARMDRALLAIPGVVGTGIFAGIADTVVVVEPDGRMRVLRRRRR
jgi:ribose 5-phosphate isomerase A